MQKEVKHQKQPTTQKQWLGPSAKCLYPEHVFSMPVIATDESKKNKKSHSKVWGMAAKFLKKSSHEPNLQDKSSVYTGIHLLFGRKDSHNHPGWKEAINKERDELLSRKEPTHVGIDWRQICQLNRTLGE